MWSQSIGVRCAAFLVLGLTVSLLLSGCDAWTKAQGTVRDGVGKPIPDATVILNIARNSQEFHSDKDGHYLVQISQPPWKLECKLTVRKTGFVPYEKQLRGPGIYKDLDVVLVPALGNSSPFQDTSTPQMPPARTTVKVVEPSQSNSTPAVDDCGLTAFPVSMSAKEILAAVPRGGASPNSTMFAKIEIDPEGKVTHLRVLRLAHPELPNAAVINEQAVDSIKRWRQAPTRIAGKPVSLCSDVDVIIDLR